MALMKYSPFRDMRKVERDFGKLWDADWGFVPTIAETAPMDLYEKDGTLVAEVTLPSFAKGEIKVTAAEGVLEILAEHTEGEEKANALERRYYMHESSNRLLRRVSLPEGADTTKTEAEFKDGVLKVSMPIQPAKETTQIPIK